MEFTKVQLSALIGNLRRREIGLNDVMEWTLNALMRHEHSEHLISEPVTNKANGYRRGRSYGQGKILELRIPRDRNGQFYPRFLALLHDHQGERQARDEPIRARPDPGPARNGLRGALWPPLQPLVDRTHARLDAKGCAMLAVPVTAEPVSDRFHRRH